jgi:predicted metal-dependent HD superfamily phosphohydrolase
MSKSLESRIFTLWKSFDARGDVMTSTEVLVDRYREPHRYWHNERHIAECLDTLEANRDLALCPAVLALALAYHDAVYDVKGNDNEAQSALLCLQDCQKLGIAPELSQYASRMILEGTAHHSGKAPQDPDAKLVHDIDLLGLAAKPKQFREMSRLLALEYFNKFGAEEYRQGRLRFLQCFQARNVIFLTERFYNKYEMRARKNITKSILLYTANGKTGSTIDKDC